MAGNNSIRGDETITFTDNMSFDGTERGGKMTTNGQLWIGSTIARHVKLGSITSPLGTLQIGYSDPNITLDLSAPVTDLHDTRYIVSAGGLSNGANFTTISSAVTAAALTGVHQTVMIQPGTYTENFTLPPNINLTAHDCDAETPNVTILGKITYTGSGTSTISGIRLQTNGDFFLSVSGANDSVIKLKHCYLNCANNIGIQYTASGGANQMHILGCQGTLGATNLGYWTKSATGDLIIFHSDLFFGSASTTATSHSVGKVLISFCNINFPLACSSTGYFSINHSNLECNNQSFTALTLAGTQISALETSRIYSDSAVAISIGTGTQLKVDACVVDSTNTNAIDGAGSITYSNLTLPNTSSNISTTTQIPLYDQLGKYRAMGQPCFLAFLGASVTNVTGDGTAFQLGTTTALTEVFDQDSNFNTNGTFTAPVTGRYLFACNVLVQEGSALMTTGFNLVTSNASYNFCNNAVAIAGNNALGFSAIVDMDAADTATVTVQFSGSTKSADVFGGDRRTMMSGQLLA